MAAAIEKLF